MTTTDERSNSDTAEPTAPEVGGDTTKISDVAGLAGAAELGGGLILPLLPTPDGVIFPDMVVHVALESTTACSAAASAVDGRVVLVPRRGDRYGTVGTIARIEDRGTMPNGTPAITLRAVTRATLGSAVLGTDQGLWMNVEPVRDTGPAPTDDEVNMYRAAAQELINVVGGGRAGLSLPETDDAGVLADTIAYWPELTIDQRLELLETIQTVERLALATSWAQEALVEMQARLSIATDVQESMEKDQREVVLRRQLQAIQSELGGEDGDVIAQYRAQLDKLAESSPAPAEAVIDAITKEVDRLERTGDQGQEAGWIRTWLDSVFELPFGEHTADNLDLTEARATLDADHTGLVDVKDRVVEHLAVRKLRAEREVDADGNRERGGAILTLVGPPGVGKTSLGESIARALDRKFVRLALGGIRDEAEIRGHRRTYVGARSGRLARALVEAGTMNPVILLDEIDKIGADWRGDPSAALLEVLDPAQNHSFRDHYLEFELDLSDVIFIATANQLETIPGPLLDRVEVISIDGYTDDDKTEIATEHVVPRLRKQMGLTDAEVVLDDGVIQRITEDWTREAGVRSLERRLDKVLRKAATQLVLDPDAAPITITDADLEDLLGRPIERENIADRTTRPGVATGLAVTGAGGDVLFVEAIAADGEPGLTLTGQLGDVMKESGEIARSWLRSAAAELGIEDLDRHLHVHFPAGAVPKDGPSAGITMTTALVSLLTNRPVRSDVAMTGEITLQGRVLPIGGVKQKLLAAHRAGVTDVILPARNGRDLDDVPEQVRDALTIHLVDSIEEVLAVALAPGATVSAAA